MGGGVFKSPIYFQDIVRSVQPFWPNMIPLLKSVVIPYFRSHLQ